MDSQKENNMFNVNGYVAHYNPKSPNKRGRVYIHREVMEDFLGRKLASDEHIHHIDGNRANNVLENLELLSHSEHARRHKPSTKVIISCAVCGEGTTNKKYCSPLCSSFASRKVKNRPYKDALEQDLSEMSWCAIGRKYGVSDNAVRKWARGYGLL